MSKRFSIPLLLACCVVGAMVCVEEGKGAEYTPTTNAPTPPSAPSMMAPPSTDPFATTNSRVATIDTPHLVKLVVREVPVEPTTVNVELYLYKDNVSYRAFFTEVSSNHRFWDVRLTESGYVVVKETTDLSVPMSVSIMSYVGTNYTHHMWSIGR